MATGSRSWASLVHFQLPKKPRSAHSSAMAAAVSAGYVKEVLPPALDSTSEAPNVFDGTSRLYVCYWCPYAQRTWITRNCKGLQEKIKLVPINLQNRPAWYKEKVYPANKVPALEHNNEVKGESMDLIKYIDKNFEGPALYPEDPVKQQFAEEMFSYSDPFNKVMFGGLMSKEPVGDDIGAAFDKVEDALSKFEDGPFFLGQFSLVDITYAPFIERYQIMFSGVKDYDITKGRPKLAQWIEELNKIEAYTHTQREPLDTLAYNKKRLGMA